MAINSQFDEMVVYGLGRVLEEGLEHASPIINGLVEVKEKSGMALCKFLHGINYRWVEIPKEDGDTFWGWAVRTTGFSLPSIQRDVCVAELFAGDYIPIEYREKISEKPMRLLKRMYRVALHHKKTRNGNYTFVPSEYELDSHDWLRLSEVNDEVSLYDAIDKITNRKPNKNRTSFAVDDNGTLWFFRGNDKVAIGSLNVFDETPLVQEGVAIFIERLGVKELHPY
jgi:hypothetical protein